MLMKIRLCCLLYLIFLPRCNQEKLTTTMSPLRTGPNTYDLYVRYLLSLSNAGRKKRFEVCILMESNTKYSSDHIYEEAPAGVVFMEVRVGVMVQSGKGVPVKCLLQDQEVPPF